MNDLQTLHQMFPSGQFFTQTEISFLKNPLNQHVDNENSHACLIAWSAMYLNKFIFASIYFTARFIMCYLLILLQ